MKTTLGTLCCIGMLAWSGSAVAAEPGAHTGFNMGAQLGFHNPRGREFGNQWEPGAAFKLDLGWRVMPVFALESGFYTGVSALEDNDDLTGVLIHIFNLDVRYFPFGAGRLEPNLLVGYTVASAASLSDGDATSTFSGYSPNLGIGVRFHATNLLYLSGDYRYMYNRYTRFAFDDGAGNEFDGKTTFQLHGDDMAFLLGAGLQF